MIGFALFLTSFLILSIDASYTPDDVSQYMEDSIDGFKLNVHKASQRGRRRVKRTVDINDFIPTGAETAFESQIFNITPWQSIPTMHPVELEPFKINDIQYLAVVNFKNLQNKYQTTSGVYVINSTNQFDLLQEFKTTGGIDFEFANLGAEKYAIFLDHVGQDLYGGSTYEKWFQLQQFLPSQNLEKPFQYRTKVRALGAKRVKVFSKNGRYYFVTANSYYEQGNQYHVKSTMHVQAPFGYELVQTFETSGAQDVEVILIDGVRYILFVNHRDNSGKVDIYSLVYRERINPQINRNSRPFELYQRIATHGARDFEYFSFDGGHYLVVANEYTHITTFDSMIGQYVQVKDFNIDSIIYWWSGTMWVEWQRIPTYGAVKWSFFTNVYGDPMLVVANTKAQATIFTYDPLRGIFKPTDVQGLSPFPDQQDFVPDVRSVMAFQSDSDTFLAVANYNETTRGGYNIFKLSFSKKPVPKLDPSVPEIISELLMRMKNELEAIKTSLSTVLLEVTNNVMTKSTEQNITSNIIFNNLTVSDTLVTNNTYYRGNVTVNPVELSAKQAVLLKEKLAVQEAKILEIQGKFNDAVKINEDAFINGKKTFTKDLTINNTLATNVTTVVGLVDATNITHLKEKSWSKSEDQILNGHYTISDNVLITENVTANGLINGRSVSSLLTTNTQQTISGLKQFVDNLHISNDVTLENFTLNSFNVPNDFVTRDGVQVIEGNKTFTDVNFDKDVTLYGLLSGMNISEFNRDKMTLSTNQTISNEVIFESGFTVDSDLTINGLIDGVNISALQDDVMMAGKTQIITGRKTFVNVTIKSSLKADNINGYHLSEAVTTNTVQTLTENVIFNNVTVKGDIISKSTIDGIDLSTHAVMTYGNQSIGGLKRITSPITNLYNDTTIAGVVDGVNLSSWQQNAVRKDTMNAISGKKTFNGITIDDNLNANQINNINMATLKDNLISVSTNDSLDNSFIFENVVVNKNLHLLGKINNYSIPDDFVTLNTVQDIRGTKIFHNKTIVTGNLQSNVHINGENFTQFYESAMKNGTNETIVGDVIFANDVHLNNIDVVGTVNSLSIPDDIVTLNTIQNVSGWLNFTEDATFQDVVNTYIVHVNGTVDDIDIYELERSVIHKDRNQTINGSVIFADGIDCKMNLSIAGLINNVNLTELLETTVRLTRDQEVYGQKTFESDVQFENTLTSPGLINGVNLTDLEQNIMKLTGTQTVNSDVVFKKEVRINNNIKVSNDSLVNNINLKSYVKNAAKNGEENIINGNLSYGNIEVQNLHAKTIDNINTSNILLTRSNQTVTGNIRFTSLEVENLKVTELVNNLNITDVHHNAVRKNVAQNITGRYSFTNLHVKGNVVVAGNINDINLQDFDTAAVHLNKSEIINGQKSFDNVTFGNVNFKGLLNGVNMTLLADDTLMKTRDQIVCFKKTFSDVVTIKNNNAQVYDIYTKGLVNNVDITALSQNAVRLNEDQTLQGIYNFKNGVEVVGDLTINGLLNDADLQQDFVKTRGDYNVSGFKQIYKMDINGNFTVNRLIDGVDVEDLESNRVTLTTNQSLFGHKKFQDVIMKNDINFADNATLNSLDISEELVLTNGTSYIGGNKRFKNVLVTNDVNTTTGVINEIDLRNLNKNSLKTTGGQQSISSDQLFLKNLTIHGDMVVNGLINGIRVSEVTDYEDNVGDDIKNELLGLSLAATSLCQRTTQLLPVSSTEKIVTGIQKTDTIYFPTKHLGEIHSTVVNNNVFISVARARDSTCGLAYVLKCSEEMQCVVLQNIVTNANKMEFFEYAGYTALYVSHWNSGTNDTTCKQDPEIYIYSSNQLEFVPYQTLNVDLMESPSAPLLNSSVLLSNYMEKTYGHNNNKNNNNGGKKPHQKLEVRKFTRDNSKEYIAIAGSDEESKFIDILFVNGTKVKNLKKKQRIKTKGKHVSVGKLKNGKVVLAASSSGNGGSTKLFVQDKISGEFKFYQKLQVTASQVKFKNIGKKSFLSYADPAKGFGYCSWQGASGYTGCNSLDFTDTKTVETIITTSGAYTLAGTDDVLMIFRTLFEGNDNVYEKNIC